MKNAVVLDEIKLEVPAGKGLNWEWLGKALINPAEDIYSECYWRQSGGGDKLGTVHYIIKSAQEQPDGTLRISGQAQFTRKDSDGHDYPDETISGVITPTTAFWPGSERTPRGDVIYHGVVVIQAYHTVAA